MACPQIINALKLLHLPMMDFQTKETGECTEMDTGLESDGSWLNLYSTSGKIK